jgi:hypothetical protein
VIAWILAVLATFPVHREDRDTEAKQAQFREVAEAIETASKGSRWRAAMLLTMGRYETDWSLRIMAGGCRAGTAECDRGRAVSSYQLHVRTCSSPEAWERARADIRVASLEAARAIGRARGMCRSVEREGGDIVRATFSALAGRGCHGSFRGLDARVATAKRILRSPP